MRISNAGFTITALTALPLLAAKDWGVFRANGLDVELIVMSPTLAAAAIAQGDIDYVAGVGPASVAAPLSGLPSRAIWFSSDRISYWPLGVFTTPGSCPAVLSQVATAESRVLDAAGESRSFACGSR